MPLPSEVEPHAYTLLKLPIAIETQLRLLPANAQEVTINVRFHPDYIRTIDRTALPQTVGEYPVGYPEQASDTYCVWQSVVECWDGAIGDDWTSCYWFSWTGNNL